MKNSNHLISEDSIDVFLSDNKTHEKVLSRFRLNQKCHYVLEEKKDKEKEITNHSKVDHETKKD